MAWSTSQLAELADTTVKAVRHYHEIGLLHEPERAANGYKQYEVEHLVRLLRIKRLADLGVPLAQVAQITQDDDHPENALRVIDTELEATIERLQSVRSELAAIFRHQAPVDLPSGFSEVGLELTERDRALILIYAQVFGPVAMDGLLEMLKDSRQSAHDAEFDSLAPDADESTRQEIAVRYAPHVKYLTEKYAWLSDPGADSARGSNYAVNVIGKALVDLYNPAQMDVLKRVNLMLAGDKDSTVD